MINVKRYNRLFLILIIFQLIMSNIKKIGSFSIDTFSLNMILIYLIVFILGLIAIKKDDQKVFDILPFNIGLKLKTAFYIVLLVFAAFPVTSLLSVFGATVFGNFMQFATKIGTFKTENPIELFFSTACVPAFFEELYFRGFFYTPYKKTRSIRFAIILSAILFGIFHMNVQQFLYAFALGVVIAIIRELTGSMWAGILFHFVNNAFASIMMLIPGDISNVDVYWFDIHYNTVTEFVISLITIFLSIIISVMLLRAIAKNEGKLKAFNTFFKDRKRKKKTKVISPSLILGIIVCIGVMAFFSFILKFLEMNPNYTPDKKLEEIYDLRNPVTNCTMVVKKDGTVLLNSTDPDISQVGICKDERTGDVNYIYKTYKGEKVVNDIPSERCVLYDRDGKEIGFEINSYAPYKVLNDYIIYYESSDPYSENEQRRLKIYDAKNKVLTDAPHTEVNFFSDHLCFSSELYSDYDLPKETIVVDDKLKTIKTIPEYTINTINRFGDVKVAKAMKRVPKVGIVENDGSVDTNEFFYNYIDKNFNLIFDESTNSDEYNSDSSVVRVYTNDREYDFDFGTMKKVSEDKPHSSISKYEIKNKEKMKYKDLQEEIQKLDKKYIYVDTYIYNDKVLFFANYENPKLKNDWKNKTDVYNKDKILLKTFNYVNTCDEDLGRIFANFDSFYDFDLNLLKKFNKKSAIEKIEWNDTVYYADNCDENYNQRDSFNLYDKDFNVIDQNINKIDRYSLKNKLLIVDKTGTRIYDKKFNLIDTLERRLEFRDWYGIDKYAFTDLSTGLMGVTDKNLNILVDNLKFVDNLCENYFTYQKGFKYGLMDYNGKALFKYSIFDTMNDSDRQDYINKQTGKYPRVDGSTANMPMMAQIRADYLGEDLETAENYTTVTTTDYAWRNLLDGKNDLLLVYEPSSETKKIIKESNVKLKITPIGVDALVFIVNESNPIKNLTTKQLRDIYSGKITNWKELGGNDQKIEAFQRELNSGSQTLFLNLLMKGVKPMDAPTSYQIQGMGELIEKIASYNNKGNAIGYSVFYYAKKMYSQPGLRLISVDGVEPNDTTIAEGKYPFLNEYYLVIREDTPKDSETMKLYNYILSDKGTEAIKKAGYIPAKK